MITLSTHTHTFHGGNNTLVPLGGCCGIALSHPNIRERRERANPIRSIKWPFRWRRWQKMISESDRAGRNKSILFTLYTKGLVHYTTNYKDMATGWRSTVETKAAACTICDSLFDFVCHKRFPSKWAEFSRNSAFCSLPILHARNGADASQYSSYTRQQNPSRRRQHNNSSSPNDFVGISYHFFMLYPTRSIPRSFEVIAWSRGATIAWRSLDSKHPCAWI